MNQIYMLYQILIVGYGIVGKMLGKEFVPLCPDIYDKYVPENNRRRDIQYDLAFICVDTPFVDENNPCDTTEVFRAVMENDAKLFVVKSTVLPGTCEKLADQTGKRIVFSPENAGNTQFSRNYKYDFTILGGEESDCCEVIQILQNVYDCQHRFSITDWRTAELVKYMGNAYLATNVSFCVQFWSIAQQCGVSYERMRELLLLDPRIDPSHTFVFADHPFWKSHCFDKDVPAIAAVYSEPFLDGVIAFNKQMKAQEADQDV